MKHPALPFTETYVLSGIPIFRRSTRDRAIHVLSAACLSVGATALSAISLNAQRLGGMAASAQPIGGISCDAQEGQRMHIHQHLVILDHGKQVPVPFNVGQPENVPCIYWLHTHKTDGIIHVEAPLNRKFTLGEFFAIWGQPLNKTRAATAVAAKGTTLTVYVNGKKYVGDPSKIDLVSHADIVIIAGPPFTKPPAFTAWGTL